MNDLLENVQEILDQCEEIGMVLPWIVCCVSPNGSMLALRVVGNGAPTDTLAEHSEGKGFQLPMTVAVIDQRNEAVRITLKASSEKTWN